jgi:hypothetical protein
MSLKLIVERVIAGWVVLGIAGSAAGQVWLEPRVVEISDERDVFEEEDRYGGYEPVSLEAPELADNTDGPLLIARTDEWTLPRELSLTQPLPAPSEPKREPSPPAAGPSPSLALPSAAPPVVIDYGYALPSAEYRCPPWRPCGPHESFGGNWLVPQGFAGADFRPACARHDACLMSGCFSRKACDRMFLADMDCACNCSMFPFLCRLEARKCYLCARLFGWLWY